ncbi:MAG: sugar phosphate isomerase/epimerase [Ktedonobacteraceae bacterium]|nr:sugar phosphate isomerase/epimerase [Ktedonobacteraceae bacterium]
MSDRTTSQTVWPRVGAMTHEADFKRGEWQRLITTCRSYGLGAIQLGGPLLDEVLDDPQRIPVIRHQLEEHDIVIAGIAGYSNIISRNGAKLRASLDFLNRCLEIAPQLDIPVVATETGTYLADSDWKATPANHTPEAWHTLTTTLSELLPVAEQHGSILALEGYINNIISSPERMQAILEQFPSPALQVVLDPFNYLSSSLLPHQEQFTATFLRDFEQHFALAHLKDVSSQGAEIDTPEFGQGVFTYALYFDFLRQRRPDLPLVLEHLSWDHIPGAIQQLHQLIETTP